MSLLDHVEAIKKEMSNMSNQLTTNKTELDRARQDMTHMQLNLQQVNDPAIQNELQKVHETSKKLESIALRFLATVADPSQQQQLMAELEQISKNAAGGSQMPVMTPPMMNAAVAAMQPHLMMRNPMLNAMAQGSPRGVPGKGGAPNGGGGGMNGVLMQQMQQMQAMAQVQQAHAIMQAQMFQGMPMIVPGMMGGMPPGMAGLPGMIPPNSMAAMQQQYQAFQQMAAAAAAASAAPVSTPSRNPSTSGAASRTRTPLTASATNSPRPTTEPTTVSIKEEEPSMENDAGVVVAATTVGNVSIKQEENSTVAVA